MLFLFSFANIFLCGVMWVNALAILSERRFLAKWGLGNAHAQTGPAGGDPQFFADQPGTAVGGGAIDKAGVANFLGSVRTLTRMPLIVVNVITIVFMMLFG